MKLTQGVISRKEALKLSPDYVAYVEGDFSKYDKVDTRSGKLKVGQKVLTFVDGVFVIAKVSSMNHKCFQAVDGPVVRVSNGEFSWRVDGDEEAYPIK